MEELNELWEIGVHVRNAVTFNDQIEFNMRAMLMWTIHDLPSYGTIVGLVTKGYRGCPICSTHIIIHRSKTMLFAMKSHDHHVMLQQILLVGV